MEQLASLSIGQRDGLLWTLRERLFGSQLISLAVCPNCSDRLELTFSVSDIRCTTEGELASTHALSAEGYDVQFRLPNSLDLNAVAQESDLTVIKQQLLDRCLLSMQHQGELRPREEMPAAVLQAVVAEMAQLDPQADLQLALSCPVCEHQWQAPLDVVSFLWGEVNAWARRVLREVHTFARVYGWRESDILAMSAQRRQWYLEMISE
jgi:uncharacterized protein YbaR (Trm112 family)